MLKRQILVTSALPYANGSLHLGHIIEAVQTDVWARFQRLQGNDCIYVCAEDTHGTPIMIKAQAEGMTPEALIASMAKEHQQNYQGFLIGHDHFHSTHSAENADITRSMYLRIREAGHIATRTVRQAYDQQANMFLPDRFVRGTCPRCATPDQYGDSCENCGATYTPADLQDPRSQLTGTVPVWRDSEHYFFKLSHFEAMLKDWVAGGSLQASVRAKLAEWFAAGLQDWDISRDAPYFGFEIPDAPGKFFYVWFDAPIGYLGSFQALCAKRGLTFDDYFGTDSKAELYHFIGKDISYFHTLFWPAVLHAAGYRRPTAVHVHGFLTVNGTKMSKSRGTFITASRYLELLPPEPLRYYFTAKLGNDVDDIDFSLDDFVARANSDIVGKLVNIASRCAGFIERGGAQLASELPEPALYGEFSSARPRIASLFETRDYAAAIREIMLLAAKANQYVDAKKPWALAKDPSKGDEVRAVATQGINMFRALMLYLAPVLPKMACEAAQFLNAPLAHWDELAVPLLGTTLRPYVPLATRLDPKIVSQLVATPVEPEPATITAPAAQKKAAPTMTGPTGNIKIDEFAKLDLRAALVKDARLVEGSDKLLQLTLDIGTETRNVFSGIRVAYLPEQLIGRYVVMIANLEPRKMRFGVSEGMVLCAGDDASGLFLLSADAGVKPGMKIT